MKRVLRSSTNATSASIAIEVSAPKRRSHRTASSSKIISRNVVQQSSSDCDDDDNSASVSGGNIENTVRFVVPQQSHHLHCNFHRHVWENFNTHKDATRATAMAKYMRSQQFFFGVMSPQRKNILSGEQSTASNF
jgi:hypothetical protein